MLDDLHLSLECDALRVPNNPNPFHGRKIANGATECPSVWTENNIHAISLTRKEDRAMRPIWVLWKISGVPDYAHGYFGWHFKWTFVPIDPVNVRTKYEVHTFTHSCGYATVCRLSVSDVLVPWSNRLEYFKIILRLISLRLTLGLTPTWASWCNGNTPEITAAWEWGNERQNGNWTAISLKWCKIEPRLLWRTNRKSYTCFRLVPKSMTLDDRERYSQGPL